MSKYIFENKDKKMFEDCTGDEMKQIVEGAKDGRVELFNSNAWHLASRSITIFFIDDIYRVLSPPPTPNQIDWSQFPDWAKVCVTDCDGESHILSLSYSEIFWDGQIWDAKLGPKDVKIVKITDSPGFKRGTVAPKDSLLIRPWYVPKVF